jgi:polysaccharide export outer membrane protein
MLASLTLRPALSLAFLLLLSLPASADYIVRAGDVLELDVAGVSSLHQKLPVGLDGQVRVPLIGEVEADGKPLTEIAATIQQRFGSKTLRQTTDAGQEYRLFFEPEQIQVHIAEYRPIYVSGDVVRPGLQTFRPGMTVRQSIALAGGYDTLRNREADPLFRIADLNAEINGLHVDLARDQIQIQRIKRELAGETSPGEYETEDLGLPANLKAELGQLENQRFAVNVAEHDKELSFIKSALETSAARSETLADQAKQEKDGLKLEEMETARLIELAKSGTATAPRVFEARRSTLFASARYLQTVAQITQLKKDEADLNRQLHKLDSTRQGGLLKDLQEAVVRIDVAEGRIKAAKAKLAYATGPRLTSHESQPPALTIVRQEDGKAVKRPADADEELMPGDVVEAALKAPVPQLPATQTQ